MGSGRFGRWALAGGVATWAFGAEAVADNGFRHHRDHVLGTSLDFVAATDQDRGARALDAVLAEIARLDPILSQWRTDSELSALNQATTFRASPDLFGVIARAERMRSLTGENFSARIGAVSAAWRDAAARDRVPSSAELAVLAREAVAARVAMKHADRTIMRPDGVRFDVDGAAKGYVIDRALAAARKAAPEAKGFMLDIGGDIGAWGKSQTGAGWRVGVAAPGGAPDNAPPVQVLALGGNAIAVSGRGARDFNIGTEAHSHLIDANGWTSRENLQASVIAPTAEQADAVATALAVMPARAGLDLVETLPGFAAQIVDAQGGVHTCSSWSLFVVADQAGVAPAVASAGAWPQNYAVSVSFEVPRVADTTKPYIAIWITDAQRNVVRTLMVIGDKARWRESNYVFWRRVERTDLAAVESIARPTRAPGRYTVAWDGLDNAGRAVGQGQYTLNIEASREHGSHNVQTIPLTLGAAPLQSDAPAQGELGATQVRYGASS